MPKASTNCSLDNSIGAIASRIKATLFGWKPGTSPVIVPSSTPSIENAMSNSSGKNGSLQIRYDYRFFAIVEPPIMRGVRTIGSWVKGSAFGYPYAYC
jgi:hypothetical protein